MKTVNGEQEEKKTLSIKKKIFRITLVVVIFLALCVLGYFILVWTGAWEYINSAEKLRQLILSLGFWGRLGFVIIQFLQVTFLPIPSTISTLAGVLIYGPLQAALLSLAGILLGSVFAFFLGRVFGRKLVVFMVGKETCDKWTEFLTNAKYSFFVMMVLPVFPDDVLCLVAGLTDMSWSFFVLTNLISRPIGIFLTCYLGSGTIIPYHGWGLVAWGFIVVAVVIILVLSYKYRAQIENYLKKVFHKENKKNSSRKSDEKRDGISENNVEGASEIEVVDKNKNDKKGDDIGDEKGDNKNDDKKENKLEETD